MSKEIPLLFCTGDFVVVSGHADSPFIARVKSQTNELVMLEWSAQYNNKRLRYARPHQIVDVIAININEV